jgi:ribulose-5-phosphate 4-epimerase/fuculose-1-phosphate aldolase
MSMDATDVEEIARSCRVLGKLEMTYAQLGHVSKRIGDTDTMLIKGKGPAEVGLSYTGNDDIISVDFDANKIDGAEGLQPPSESFLHIWLYRKNPAIGSIVHMHPMYAQLLTACDKKILPFFAAAPMCRIALEDLPTYPRGIIIADDRLGEDFATFMGQSSMALMQGHGITVTGSSVADASVRALDLGWTLKMTYLAYTLGNPRTILQEDIDELTRTAGETDRPRGSSGGETGMLATWRYYCSAAGEEWRAAGGDRLSSR